MNEARALWGKTFFGQWLAEFQTRYRFKYVLPRIQEIELEGLRFDVSKLSPKVRNRLLSGAYEAHEKQMCLEFLSADDSVVEIGAAIGFIGLICQKRIGIKRYACFEANPRTCAILERNYELNGVRPQVWNLALAGEDGMVDLEVGSDFWENSICWNGNCEVGTKTTRVTAGRLKTILTLAGHPTTAMIVDIEGAEQFIDWTELPASVRTIIIELHPKVIGQERVDEIISALTGKGFKMLREESGTFAFRLK